MVGADDAHRHRVVGAVAAASRTVVVRWAGLRQAPLYDGSHRRDETSDFEWGCVDLPTLVGVAAEARHGLREHQVPPPRRPLPTARVRCLPGRVEADRLRPQSAQALARRPGPGSSLTRPPRTRRPADRWGRMGSRAGGCGEPRKGRTRSSWSPGPAPFSRDRDRPCQAAGRDSRRDDRSLSSGIRRALREAVSRCR